MEPVTRRCKRCGTNKLLVHDMNRPVLYPDPPSICFECWRATSWSEMKRYYWSGLAALFFGLLPLLIIIMWLIYVLWWKHRPYWGDKEGFYLFLYIPIMISIGAV